MSEENFVREVVEFLKVRDKITHVLVAEGERPLPLAAMVQRAVVTGLVPVFPLDSRQVAVYAPRGIPNSIKALGITVSSVEKHSEAGVKETNKETAVLVESGEIGSEPFQAEPSQSMATHIAGEANGPDARPPSEQPETAPSSDDSGELEDAGWSDDGLAEIASTPIKQNEQVAPLEENQGPRQAITAKSSEEALEESSGGHLHEVLRAVQAQAAETRQLFSLLAELREAIPTRDPTGDSVLAESVRELADSIQVKFDSHSCQLSEIRDSFENNALASEITEQFRRIESIIEQMAQAPATRSVTNEMKGHLARFGTALSSAISRFEDTASQLTAAAEDRGGSARNSAVENDNTAKIADRLGEIETQLTGLLSRTDAITDPLAGSLSALAEAMKGIAEREKTNQAITGLEERIGETRSLLHVVLTQLSSLTDSPEQQSAPAVEEFLGDLRYAIAELIADAKRTRLQA